MAESAVDVGCGEAGCGQEFSTESILIDRFRKPIRPTDAFGGWSNGLIKSLYKIEPRTPIEDIYTFDDDTL